MWTRSSEPSPGASNKKQNHEHALAIQRAAAWFRCQKSPPSREFFERNSVGKALALVSPQRSTNELSCELNRSMQHHLVQDVHARRAHRAVDHQFGMLVAEGFGDVAAPADGPMSAHYFLELIERDLVPLDGLALGFVIDQGGWMIVPVDFSEWFVTVGAALSLIPIVYDGRNEARLGRFLDLRETLLATALLFGPPGAGAQAQLLVSKCCFQGSLPRRNAYCRRLVVLRTSDEPLATKLQVGTKSEAEPEEQSDGNGDRYDKKDKFHGRFLSGAVQERGLSAK